MNLNNKIITILIASVWLANGLFCKVLNLVPRHQQIVEKIVHLNNARTLTILIGLAEIGMAIWIAIGYKKKLNTIAQIVIVATMNIMEYLLASELLLWGKYNSLFAFLFIVLVYCNHFCFTKKSKIQC